jgi:hypothetical protein
MTLKGVTPPGISPVPKPHKTKLLERVREVARLKHYSLRTEKNVFGLVGICERREGVPFWPLQPGFDVFQPICSAEQVHANQLQSALKNLTDAIRETEAVVETMRAEHDPLAVHICIARRQYRNLPDTKSGSRREVAARLSWQTACELGFRGSLGEWERLMGAVSRR